MTTDLSPIPSIVLNQDNLSEACLDDLQKYFWGRNIELFEPEQDENDPRIHRGTGTLLKVSCQIEALLNADRSLLILCAKPDEDWNFGTCFPLMPGESETGNSVGTFLLRFITLQDPIWIYIYSASEIDEQTLQTELDKLLLWNQWSNQKKTTLVTENGLYMWGGLPNNLPELQELTDFIEIDISTFLLQASITFPDGFPILTLQLPLGDDGCKFGPGTLKKAAIELSSPLYFLPNNSQISLIGALDLNDSKQIAINIDFPLDNDLITATGTYSDNNIPFVNPSELSDLPSLQPQGAVTLEVQFSKREKSLEKVGFSLDLENWTLIQDILTLSGLSFTFSVFDPLDSKMLIASIAAQASLGKKNPINLLCSGYYPSNQFYFSLDSQTPLKIADLVEDLGAQSDGIPDLEINDLSAEFNLNNKDFATRVDVTGTWEIINNVELNSLRFKIYGRVAYSCEIAAKFSIAGVTLNLEAQYNGEGWQFSGSTGYGQAIPIGHSAQLPQEAQPTLTEDLGNIFGEVPLPAAIEDLTIQNLGISFNTQTKDFTFTCESKFLVDGQAVDITVSIDITRQADNSFHKQFGGYITVGDLQFNLIFSKDNTAKTLLATYNNPKGDSLTIKTLVADVSDDIATYIPATLEITLKDALFAYSKNDEKTTFLFGLNLSSQINLSNLPLVGTEFPPEQTVSVDDLQFLIASQNVNLEEADSFNKLIPDTITKLPLKTTETDTTTNNETTPAIQKGFNASAKLQFGDTTEILALPITSESQPETTSESQPETTEDEISTSITDNPNTSTSDNAKWFKLQKTFGPVHFERVGVQYQDAALWFLLDAALSASGLTLSLDGLAVGSPLSQFEPEFNLKGIGIDYQGGSAVETGGAFLRKQVTRDGETYDEYDGAAIIKAETFTLSAIGSYTQYDGHPSLFIYAVLDYPLGGPSFFFVTGLAAGFGYNRALKIPTIDQVATFPLVEEAIHSNNGSSDTQDNATKLTQELNKLQYYIPPETGQIFLALGVKFTSFKTIDSFALLTVAFGKRFELNLLGLSTLIAPPEADKTPVAEVQLALKATFLPDEGFLGVRAQLTPNSYILSKKCRLTGGFAFYSWFAPHPYDGDFVLTLGGYHPKFNVPAHYPKVPRLAFDWQVNSELHIKADGYFALTPAALMAGGHLQATWHSGSLKAWFNEGADFIIAWKPYHYDAFIYVDMGVSYTYHFFGTHHISVDVGADLHIWGPEFTGKAHIHLWIVSFDVSFGASASQTPQPIDWNTFKSSFLPADSDICSIVVKDGLVRKVNQDDKSDLGVINPKHLCLVTNSVIPATDAEHETKVSDFQKFGIGSMDVKSGELTSTTTITITRDGKDNHVEEDFAYIPILKKAPTGLWGESLTPDLNGEQFIENTLSGFEIKPKKQHEPGETHAIDRQNLQFTTEPVNDAYEWETIKVFNEEEGKNIRDTITESSVKTARENLLKAMNLDLDIREIDLSENIADHFLLSPNIGTLEEVAV